VSANTVGSNKTSSGDLDITPRLLWFLEQVETAVRSSETLVAAVVQKARFWMQHAQSEHNERQLKALNRMLNTEPVGFVGGMTNKKYATLTKASPATAQRDPASLVDKGCLDLVGTGRGARYELKLPSSKASRAG
jgi:Fic family protein